MIGCWHQSKLKVNSGFTIVELLVVIVVIGILASITVVAFNGVQQRARDTARKTNLNDISKAIQLYQLDENNTKLQSSACGYNFGGATNIRGGWLIDSVDATSGDSVSKCLVSSKALSKELKDPTGRSSCDGAEAGCNAYAVAICTVGSEVKILLYAELDRPTSSDSMNDACGTGWSSLGFNYTKVVQ